MANITSDRFRWTADIDGEWLCIQCKNARETIAGISDGKVYDVLIRPHRKRRSLDANGYLWVLLDALSSKLGVPKVELYRQLIRDVGGVSEVVCVQQKAAQKLKEGWERNGLGWLTETMPSKIPGCVNVILYYGSSTYDTAQMSRLLHLVVEECKWQGIDTLTPEEQSRLEGLQ